MPQAQGTVRIDGDTVYVTVSVPVTELKAYDDNGDGRLSLQELNLHRPALLDQVNSMLELRSGGQLGQRLFEDLLIPHLHGPGAPTAPDQFKTDQLISMRRLQWAAPVHSLSMRADAFNAQGSPSQLALQAVSGSGPGAHVVAEAVVLTVHYPEHLFFQGPMATFQRFVPVGVEHILIGVDHLLFLLMVLLGTVGWRHMLAVISAFTLAHSISLALSMLGWLVVSPSLSEPLIAASIVLMALNNLRRSFQLQKPGMAWIDLALVFGFGLIHGLGFATALAELGGVSSRLWPSLLGFNLGVELGQLVFASAVLLLVRAALHFGLPLHTLRRWASVLAALAGGFLLWN